MTEINLESLFELEPSWGLRGDPFLWREMRGKIQFSANIKNASDFESRLHDLFLELTNSIPAIDSTIFVERYSLGGMSSGQVSSKFWLETGFPILLSRFKELHGDTNTNSQ